MIYSYISCIKCLWDVRQDVNIHCGHCSKWSLGGRSEAWLTEMLNTPTQGLAEIYKCNCFSIGEISQKDTQEMLCSLPAVLLQLGITVLFNLLFILPGWNSSRGFVLKKRIISPTEMKGWCRMLAATLFSQSQGHRHAVAVCWHPCMNTKAQTWKSSPAFQLSSPCHCGKKIDYNKKARKCSLVRSKIACTEIACTKYLFLEKRLNF